MKILLTGAAGFIGSNFVRYTLNQHADSDVVVLDKLTYAGRRENLHDLKNHIRFIEGDICLEKDVDRAMHGCEIVINFAAESHVDRSITGAEDFIRTNVWGAYIMLEAARRHHVERFVQISTDEVYGSRLKGSFSEKDIPDPSSPYSASKASTDLLALSYFKTYNLPVVITRSSNNFGPYQFPEKMMPLFILNALGNKPLPVYGDGRNVRDWIQVQDNCAGIDLVVQKGACGEIYNIASRIEKENLEVVYAILAFLGKPKDLIHFVQDRPGHDRRYSMDTGKIKQLGWQSKTRFENDLKETIRWYQENEKWWKPLQQAK